MRFFINGYLTKACQTASLSMLGSFGLMKPCPLSLSLLMSLLLLPVAGAAAGSAPAARGLTPAQRKLIHRSNGVYSLLEAAAAGDAATLSRRLRAGDDPNQADEFGNRPLHLAAQGQSVELIRLLLEAGADSSARNAAGQTPRQLCRQKDMLRLLTQAEGGRQRELKAFELLERGDARGLRAALRLGLDPNARSADGTSCLLLKAVENGRQEVLRALLEAHARLDVLTTTGDRPGALHLAARRGDAATIRQLLEAGADPMLRAGNGAYALHDAVWYRKLEAVRALLPAYKGSNFNPDGGRHGFPVNQAIQRGGEDFLRAFIEAGFSPNDPRFRDAQPLIIAVRSGREGCVRLLLEAGANPNARDSRGRMAADYASETLAPLLH